MFFVMDTLSPFEPSKAGPGNRSTECNKKRNRGGSRGNPHSSEFFFVMRFTVLDAVPISSYKP